MADMDIESSGPSDNKGSQPRSRIRRIGRGLAALIGRSSKEKVSSTNRPEISAPIASKPAESVSATGKQVVSSEQAFQNIMDKQKVAHDQAREKLGLHQNPQTALGLSLREARAIGSDRVMGKAELKGFNEAFSAAANIASKRQGMVFSGDVLAAPKLERSASLSSNASTAVSIGSDNSDKTLVEADVQEKSNGIHRLGLGGDYIAKAVKFEVVRAKPVIVNQKARTLDARDDRSRTASVTD